MNIAICDDLQSDRKLLENYIKEYCSKNRLDFSLFFYESGETLLEGFEKNKYDIIFLDIYMDGRSGIEIAHTIRERGIKCLIIFTTTSIDHAIESFDVQAVHYLVKPLDYDRVEKAMGRCQQLFTMTDKYIEVMSERIIVRVFLKDLIFAEIYSNMMILHTVFDEVKTYMSLDELTELLDGDEFLRCHRSYIVNMNYIAGTENSDFLLKNGDRVPIRRQDKQQIKQRYADYVFNIIRRRHNDF